VPPSPAGFVDSPQFQIRILANPHSLIPGLANRFPGNRRLFCFTHKFERHNRTNHSNNCQPDQGCFEFKLFLLLFSCGDRRRAFLHRWASPSTGHHRFTSEYHDRCNQERQENTFHSRTHFPVWEKVCGLAGRGSEQCTRTAAAYTVALAWGCGRFRNPLLPFWWLSYLHEYCR
jgi:hypothetical protein